MNQPRCGLVPTTVMEMDRLALYSLNPQETGAEAPVFLLFGFFLHGYA